MSITKESIKENITQLLPYRYYIGIAVTTVGLWIELVFFPFWQLYFLPAVFGGLIVNEKAKRGFSAGFFGMLGALLIYMNVTLISGIEAVEVLMGAAIGFSGLGIIAHVLFLLILAAFSGFGGIIGVYIYPFVPFYEYFDK